MEAGDLGLIPAGPSEYGAYCCAIFAVSAALAEICVFKSGLALRDLAELCACCQCPIYLVTVDPGNKSLIRPMKNGSYKWGDLKAGALVFGGSCNGDPLYFILLFFLLW